MHEYPNQLKCGQSFVLLRGGGGLNHRAQYSVPIRTPLRSLVSVHGISTRIWCSGLWGMAIALEQFNGRYSEDEQYAAKDKIFKEWNKSSGSLVLDHQEFKHYGNEKQTTLGPKGTTIVVHHTRRPMGRITSGIPMAISKSNKNYSSIPSKGLAQAH